jgi:hypothetical protein
MALFNVSFWGKISPLHKKKKEKKKGYQSYKEFLGIVWLTSPYFEENLLEPSYLDILFMKVANTKQGFGKKITTPTKVIHHLILIDVEDPPLSGPT